jgi:uncharacterized protein YodC (DUF2158 family)
MPNGFDFAIGDTVKAKDGSRTMTVEEVYPSVFKYRYRCVWLDNEGLPEHELFRHEQLVRFDQ